MEVIKGRVVASVNDTAEKPEKEVDDQIDQRAARANGSQSNAAFLGRISAPTPDNNGIGCVKKML